MDQAFALFPYQKKAVQWMNVNRTGILYAEMGLGKTFMTLSYLSNKKGPHLIVCGKTLIGGWLSEIKKFCNPKPKVFVYHSEFNKNLDVNLGDYDIVLTTYGKVVNENKINESSKNFFYSTHLKP